MLTASTPLIHALISVSHATYDKQRTENTVNFPCRMCCTTRHASHGVHMFGIDFVDFFFVETLHET